MLGQRMNAILKSGAIVGGLLMMLAMPSLARAVDVSDAAHFFSAEALEKAAGEPEVQARHVRHS